MRESLDIDIKAARRAERNRCRALIKLAEPIVSGSDFARWQIVHDAVIDPDATPDTVRAEIEKRSLRTPVSAGSDTTAAEQVEDPAARSASSRWHKIAERLAAEQQSEPAK